MKKPLILTTLGLLCLSVFLPTYAYTDTQVEAKATELKGIINVIFTKPKDKEKYQYVFKELFEGCAKTCKIELSKLASAKLLETYDEDFLGSESKQKEEQKDEKEEQKTENDNKPHWLRRQYGLKEVIDGDTIKIYDDDGDYKVRLIGIDAPESNETRYGYTECYGDESTKHLKELIGNNKLIQIEFDDSQGLYDKYDRMLGYLVIDGKNLNEQMLKDGYAYEYTYNKKYKYANNFQKAEKDAKNGKLGVWGEKTCLGLRGDKTEATKKVKEYEEKKKQEEAEKEERERQERLKEYERKYSNSSSSYGQGSSSSRSYGGACGGHSWHRGERGGCYYINSNGNKTYGDHSCCR